MKLFNVHVEWDCCILATDESHARDVFRLEALRDIDESCILYLDEVDFERHQPVVDDPGSLPYAGYNNSYQEQTLSFGDTQMVLSKDMTLDEMRKEAKRLLSSKTTIQNQLPLPLK